MHEQDPLGAVAQLVGETHVIDVETIHAVPPQIHFISTEVN